MRPGGNTPMCLTDNVITHILLLFYELKRKGSQRKKRKELKRKKEQRIAFIFYGIA